MKKDLINRERRQAEKKGLCIQKQTKESNMGFVKADSNVVIAGYGYYDNLLDIEEAEAFVEAC